MAEAVPLYILAGGRSRRFGTDKARVCLGGQPLVNRVAECLTPAASSVRVVGREAGQYDDLGLVTIADREADLGPLGGVEAALSDRLRREGPGLVAFAPCDWLSPTASWIEMLVAAARDASGAAFVDPEGKWQPLPGVLHTGCISQVKTALAEGEGSLWRLFEAIDGVAIPLPERLDQANTPAELRAFNSISTKKF